MAELLTLQEYCRRKSERPFDMGSASCAHFIAGWVKERTGRDGLAIFGGLTEQVARELIAQRRLLRSVMEGCRSIGLQRTTDPKMGDIGVIAETEGRVIHRCAIHTDKGWVFRDERGLGFRRSVRVLMAWSV